MPMPRSLAGSSKMDTPLLSFFSSPYCFETDSSTLTRGVSTQVICLFFWPNLQVESCERIMVPSAISRCWRSIFSTML